MSISPSQPRFRYHVAILVAAILTLVSLSDARAETATSAATVAPPPTSVAATEQQTAAPKIPACDDKASDVLPAGNLKLTVAVDPTTVWQPRGGDVKFTIKGTGFSPENMALIACFRWKADPTAQWYKSPSLRLIDNGTNAAGTFTFSATVPPDFPDAGSWWLQRLAGTAASGVSTGFYMVPIAEFRVMAKSVATSPPAWSPLDVTIPVGITNQFFAVVITVVLVVIAWVSLYRFGGWRGVPGGNDIILRIISTKSGYASLSQLQIILWSFVIGAGAIYVMSLAGNLIAITQGTLVLLGISGAATVASKLQSHTETQSAPASPPAPAGVVTGLAVNGPMTTTEARLSWAAPTGGGAPETYTVNYRQTVAANAQANPWILATGTLTRPGFRVVELTPGTPYDFQVFGVNAAGPGGAFIVSGQTQTLLPPAAQLAAVTDFRPTDVVTNSEIGLAWGTLAAAVGSKVQYRVHDSDDDWTDAKATSGSAIIKGLRANTLYDLRVAAFYPAAPPTLGPWTTIKVATTGPRMPQWSDLVVATDTQSEIDVTRVQMLFFTVIVALFVALRILTSGEIPAIPDGYLLLMGISNGVYLTAKFIPG